MLCKPWDWIRLMRCSILGATRRTEMQREYSCRLWCWSAFQIVWFSTLYSYKTDYSFVSWVVIPSYQHLGFRSRSRFPKKYAPTNTHSHSTASAVEFWSLEVKVCGFSDSLNCAYWYRGIVTSLRGTLWRRYHPCNNATFRWSTPANWKPRRRNPLRRFFQTPIWQ